MIWSSSSESSARRSKKPSRYQGHWSFQEPLDAVARHFWSATMSGERPHSSISSSVWWTARLYSPPLPSCITRNSQLPKLLRRSNCSTVHLNHFIRNIRDVSPCDTITRFRSLLASWWSLFMSMSLHSDSKKPAQYEIQWSVCLVIGIDFSLCKIWFQRCTAQIHMVMQNCLCLETSV